MRAARIATWGNVQQDCADVLGIRQSQIWRWERGQSPGAYELMRFARASNRSVDELLGLPAKAHLAEQLLLGLEPKAQAVVVDLVELLRKPRRRGA
jgi:transcriptional regulator with XRE-family HTH domain